MLKTAGLLLLALGAVLFGWRYGEKEKKKYRDLQFLLGLVDYIRNGILYGREELPSCFESYREIVPHDSLPFSGKESMRTLCNGCISMKN